MSQTTNGKAYLLKTALTPGTAVEASGSVQWYQPTTGYNHPGDLVIKDRIILTAAQNWEVADFVKAVGCKIIDCGCESNLASNQQSLMIWDFRESLTAPKQYILSKFAFNQILPSDNQMDNSDADDLWGGDVCGNLIINFESKWLRWMGSTSESLGQVQSWEPIKADIPTCFGESPSGAGKLFVNIKGSSFLASIPKTNEGACYTLLPAIYFSSNKTVSVLCEGMIKNCITLGQLLDLGGDDSYRAFQTITDSPNGTTYMTSLDIHGTLTATVASDVCLGTSFPQTCPKSPKSPRIGLIRRIINFIRSIFS